MLIFGTVGADIAYMSIYGSLCYMELDIVVNPSPDCNMYVYSHFFRIIYSVVVRDIHSTRALISSSCTNRNEAGEYNNIEWYSE